MNTEKLTLNINTIDLANIDLLVENGFASNRSDLMKNAIKNYLASLDKETKLLLNALQMKAEREQRQWYFGFNKLGIDYFNEMVSGQTTGKILAYGTFSISKKIPLDVIKKVIKEIKVYGVFIASKEVKDFYKGK
jgi:Arc/MetJ-type ribon-helix-helix transcriptional regulator